MSSHSTIIKDTFRKYRDTLEPVRQAIILQVIAQDGESVKLTDGRNVVHYGYQREDQVMAELHDTLEHGGFEAGQLDGSFFSFAEVSFDYFWDLVNRELVVCLVSSHARLIDSGIGQKKPEKVFYITMELSTRRQEMLKRQAMSKTIKPVDEGLPLDDIFGVATTGGICSGLEQDDSMEGEEETNSEDDGSAKGGNTTKGEHEKTNMSQGITPNKAEITQIGLEKSPDQEKENIKTSAPNTSQDQTKPETCALTDQSNKPEKKKRKPRAPKPKPVYATKEKVTEAELAMLDNELDDLDLDEEVSKQMVKVKLNNDPIRRGGLTTATEDEIKAPQTLGLSTFALSSGFF